MILAGRYQLGEVLGSNSIGTTYQAKQLQTGAIVVVKEFSPQGLPFKNDYAVLASRSELEGIVRVLEVLDENMKSYAVMEYVEGVSLEKYLSDSGRKFPVARIKTLITPIVSSLQALHEAGVIHGNISPDNLIFTEEGTLKLIGFGTVAGQASLKSADYMALKQVQGLERTFAMDVYSLCASIYRCITGKAPLKAQMREAYDGLEAPSALGIEIDEMSEAALLMGLKVDESKRLRTMMALKNSFCNEQQAKIPVPPVAVQPEQVKIPVPPVTVQSEPVKPLTNQPEEKNTVYLFGDENNNGSGITPGIGFGAGATGPSVGPVIAVPDPAPNLFDNDVVIPPEMPKEEKKKGGAGIVIAIVASVLLVAALGVSAFFLVTKVILKNDIDVVQIDEEEEEVSSDSEEEESEWKALEDKLAAGDYETVITEAVALYEGELSDDDLTALDEIMKQAVTGKYNAIMAQVDNCVASGDYNGAYAAIENGALYFDTYSENMDVVKYVNIQGLSDKINEVEQGQISALLSSATSCANQANEAGVEDAILQLEQLMDSNELAVKKEAIYAKLVITTITAKRNNGEDAASILNYINENLAKTGNNSWVMELWDYIDAVYTLETGAPMIDSKVRNVSGNGYLLENSDTQLLTQDDFSHLSQYELRLAYYEIYARHGRTFSDQAVTDHFLQYGWYQGTTSPEAFDENSLSDIEKQNRDLIVAYQEAMGYR